MTPSAEDVAAALEEAIAQGEYAANARLPSERVIGRRFGVTRRAAQAAVKSLEARGIVYRLERGGTFVGRDPARTAESAEPPALKCANFLEPVRPRGDMFTFALPDYLHGYTRALQHHLLRVRFMTLVPEETTFDTVLNPAVSVEQQGCILGDLLRPSLMEWLHAHNVPFVVRRYGLYDERGFPKHHGVYLNHNGATYEATTHLMKLGHKCVACVGKFDPDAGYRPGISIDPHCWFEGYRSAFCVAGRSVKPEHQAHASGASPEEAYEAATRLLRLPEPPTAIVCENDLTAFGVMKAAQEMGVRIPEDLSVTGFDNDPAGAKSSPPLTTFSGHEELAFTAVKKLFEAASGQGGDYRVEPIDCTMILRESTAPPRKH